MKDEQENTEGFVKKTAKTIGGGVKKAVVSLQKGGKVYAEKKRIANHEAQLKKYNPLFLDEYQKERFTLPNVIIIVDDAVRKGIEVCKGAIGWISKEKGVEVLHLYDEAIERSGLNFFPAPTCDTVYYVDMFDRKKFIQIDTYFAYAHEARLAELQHIAFSLGAKEYSVDIIDKRKRTSRSTFETKIEKDNGKKKEEKEKYSYEMKTTAELGVNTFVRAGAKAIFQGERAAVPPTLLWFAKDNNILNLIAMRCDSNTSGALTQYDIELHSANSASMSLSVASKLNASIGAMGIKLSCNIKQMSASEHNQTLIYKLVF